MECGDNLFITRAWPQAPLSEAVSDPRIEIEIAGLNMYTIGILFVAVAVAIAYRSLVQGN